MTLRQLDKVCGRICSLIRRSKTFFLSGHRKPDGDTVASELAMASLLRRLGKSVDIYNYESVPQSLMFLPGAGKIKTAQKVAKTYDVAMIFECNDSDRMGNIIDLDKQAGTAVNIDHHLKHSLFGDLNMVNVGASSNSEQLFYVFEKLKMPITKDEATCLYLGIMTDTGRFQHSNTNAETLRISSKLVGRGVDVSLLSEKIYGTRSFPALKLLGHSLSALKLSPDGKIAWVSLSKKDFSATRSGEEDTDEIVNYGLQVPTAVVSILFRQSALSGSVKVSLRSRRGVNVCSLAERFGGGGHKYASGCKLEGPLDRAVRDVLSGARELLRRPSLSLSK